MAEARIFDILRPLAVLRSESIMKRELTISLLLFLLWTIVGCGTVVYFLGDKAYSHPAYYPETVPVGKNDVTRVYGLSYDYTVNALLNPRQ